jgi:F-type H+-transporting ATPase subunit delta
LASGDLGAKRYAAAAFELARESGDLNGWATAISEISEFMSNSSVESVLENTRLSVDAKMNLLDQALGTLPPLALNLARLLVRKGRTRLAPEISLEFRRLADESQGIEHAKAITAVAMTDAERQALIDRLQSQTGKRIVLETEVDPELLGGLVLQTGDKLVDASVRARLQSLRERLVGAV